MPAVYVICRTSIPFFIHSRTSSRQNKPKWCEMTVFGCEMSGLYLNINFHTNAVRCLHFCIDRPVGCDVDCSCSGDSTHSVDMICCFHTLRVGLCSDLLEPFFLLFLLGFLFLCSFLGLLLFGSLLSPLFLRIFLISLFQILPDSPITPYTNTKRRY